MYSMGADPIQSQIVDDVRAAMRPLTNLDNRTLRELVDDDSKIEEHLNKLDLSNRKTICGRKEMIMTTNKSLAEYNLSFEPLLESGKANLKQLLVQIEQVRNDIEQKEEQLRKHSGSMTSETALALLQTAAAESEEESEKLSEMFYQKDLDVDEFLEKFQDTRKRMHLRRVKAEKMADLVSQKSDAQNSRPLSGPRRAAPLPPYPVGPSPFFNNII